MLRVRAGIPFEALVTSAAPGLVGQITVEVYDPTDGATILAPTTAGIAEPRPGTYRAVLEVATPGTYAIRWLEPGGLDAQEELHVLTAVPVEYQALEGAVDVRIMIPRVRRALEGAGQPSSLSAEVLRDIVADAAAALILYTGSLFGAKLLISARDAADDSPLEYATSRELTLPEQTALAAQAALDYFFFLFAGMKVSERIADEGSAWEYQRSANLLVEQLKQLREQRDAALAAIDRDHNLVLDAYSSFLEVRDRRTAAIIEPYIAGLLGSGQEDYRFGVVG